MKNDIIKIKNFDLKFFKSLLEQNLMLDNKITILFKSDMVVSAALTSSRSAMKIWTAPMNNFIIGIDPAQQVLNFDDFDKPEDKSLDFEPFNFYVLKGDILKRYISVFNNDPVDVEIIVNRENDIASSMKITGCSTGGASLSSNFILTSDEMITNKINDYESAINSVSPKETMSEFILGVDDVKEVKKLIKELHKSDRENTSFITFQCDPEKNVVIVKDKVFDVRFDMVSNIDSKYNQNDNLIEFDILKSDFIVSGNHTFSFYSSNEDFHIILSAAYKKCVISCLISKTSTNEDEFKNDQAMSNSISDTSLNLDEIDVEEYFD